MSKRCVSPAIVSGFVGLFIAVVFAGPAVAAVNVSGGLERGSVYLGESVHFQISITDAPSAPDIRFPAVQGLAVAKGATTQSTNSNVSIINGQMTQESHTTQHITYVLTPSQGGLIHIPAVEIIIAGQTYGIPASSISVITPDKADAGFLEVDAVPDPVVIGGTFKITLRIYLQRLMFQNQILDNDPFTAREALALQIPWFENLPNCETKDFQSFASGYIGRPGFSINNYAQDDFFNFNRRLILFRPPRTTAKRGDKEYYVYTIEKTFKPVKTGTIELSPSSIKGNLLDQVIGPNQATQRSLYQISRAITVRVIDPPEAGRPAEWNGAIGQFSVDAKAGGGKVPVEINLGDPVVLSLAVRGDGLWSTVQAPDLLLQEDFARSFKIHDRDVPGEVTGDGRVFRYTIRPARADVTEIPPVRFAYFDLAKKIYRVIQTRPIALRIRSTEKVGLDDVVEAAKTATVSEVKEVIEGLYANRTEPERVLSARHATRLGRGWAVLFTPMLFVVTALASAVWSRRDLRKLRAAKALGGLRAAVASLKSDSAIPGSDFASRVSRLAAVYTADRLGLSADVLTASDIRRLLTTSGVSPGPASRIVDILHDLERMQYSSGSGGVERVRVCDEIQTLFEQIDSEMKIHPAGGRDA